MYGKYSIYIRPTSKDDSLMEAMRYLARAHTLEFLSTSSCTKRQKPWAREACTLEWRFRKSVSVDPGFFINCITVVRAPAAEGRGQRSNSEYIVVERQVSTDLLWTLMPSDLTWVQCVGYSKAAAPRSSPHDHHPQCFQTLSQCQTDSLIYQTLQERKKYHGYIPDTDIVCMHTFKLSINANVQYTSFTHLPWMKVSSWWLLVSYRLRARHTLRAALHSPWQCWRMWCASFSTNCRGGKYCEHETNSQYYNYTDNLVKLLF